MSFGVRVLVAIYLYCVSVEYTLLSQFLSTQGSKLELSNLGKKILYGRGEKVPMMDWCEYRYLHYETEV